MDRIIASDQILNFVNAYIENEQVNLKIVKSRKRKLGDFRYNYLTKQHLITINSDLSQGKFLLTFLHELAHKRCHEVFGRKIKPHGQQWKEAFRQLLKEALELELSLDDKKIIEDNYFNPKACCQSAQEIDELALKVSDLSVNQEFKIKNSNRVFVLIEKMRSRYKCKEKSTNKLYSVSANALIQVN